MKNSWPTKEPREQLEIKKFISAYERLPEGRSFVTESKGEKPDYLLKDKVTGAVFGGEVTSVYLDDRSVPDEHIKVIEGWEGIPDDPFAIERYESIRGEVWP